MAGGAGLDLTHSPSPSPILMPVPSSLSRELAVVAAQGHEEVVRVTFLHHLLKVNCHHCQFLAQWAGS